MNETFLSYLDFELEISRGRGREYPVAVTYSPVGEAQATMRFPYDEMALQKRLVVVQNAFLNPSVGPGKSPSPEVLVVRDFGRDLFDALFTGEVRHCYEQSVEQARQEDKGIRLKLRFQPPDLAALPWEFLYDPRRAEYICLSRNTPVVRHLEVLQTSPLLSLSLPLRILGMVAGPEDSTPLDVAREKERVETALRSLQTRGLVELTWLEHQTWRDLQEAMQLGTWHAFHFLGQGDRLSDKGLLAMAGEEGETRRMSGPDLARLLVDHPSLRVVSLNARQTTQEGQPHGGASLRNIFTSTAALMVGHSIPAVLAIPYEISDEAAIELFRAFYEALAEGMPVDAALAEARQAASFAASNSVDWGAPALYMGPPDGLLFSSGQVQDIKEPPAQAPVQPEPPPPEVPETESELEPAPVVPTQEAEEPPQEPEPEPEPPVRTPLPVEPELVLIPAGEFLMGSDPEKDPRAYEAEQPQHDVYLPDYYISRTPVTNAQYAAFLESSGYQPPNHWPDGKLPDGKEDYPVAYISWRDALAYCRWLSDKNNQTYRLPSEAEWEKAARGTDGRIYPWGDTWDPDRCNSKENGPDDTTLVDAYPDGASPYGILDMAGNVWEWTASLNRPYPYDPTNDLEDIRTGGKRALRGGAYYSTARRVRCAYRDSGNPDNWRGSYGFRVCVPSQQD